MMDEFIKRLESEIAWIEKDIDERRKTDLMRLILTTRLKTYHEILEMARQFNLGHV